MPFGEVALFIKYAIVWQVLFVIHTQNLSIFHDRSSVVALTIFGLVDKTKDHHNIFYCFKLFKNLLRAFG
ncbi:hypothetical protein D3C71_890120 [compost metagenome]